MTDPVITTIRMRIFEHRRGRFVFPHLSYDVEGFHPASFGVEAMVWALATDTKDTGEYFECQARDGKPFGFDGVWATINAPLFECGGGPVIFISGPVVREELGAEVAR